MEVQKVDDDFSEWEVGVDELRPCDGCRACCSAMAVEELGKPNYTTCKYECEKGCSIYGNHPGTCRAFFCLWKLPNWLLKENDRPDKLGVVFYVRTEGETKQLEIWELWPGAAKQPQVVSILTTINADYVLVSPAHWTFLV